MYIYIYTYMASTTCIYFSQIRVTILDNPYMSWGVRLFPRWLEISLDLFFDPAAGSERRDVPDDIIASML